MEGTQPAAELLRDAPEPVQPVDDLLGRPGGRSLGVSAAAGGRLDVDAGPARRFGWLALSHR